MKDGVVTLADEVGSYAEKWHAERATQRMAGVKALAIDMTVKLSGLGTRTDADIAQSVKSALEWTTFLPVDSVKAVVEDGWVTGARIGDGFGLECSWRAPCDRQHDDRLLTSAKRRLVCAAR